MIVVKEFSVIYTQLIYRPTVITPILALGRKFQGEVLKKYIFWCFLGCLCRFGLFNHNHCHHHQIDGTFSSSAWTCQQLAIVVALLFLTPKMHFMRGKKGHSLNLRSLSPRHGDLSCWIELDMTHAASYWTQHDAARAVSELTLGSKLSGYPQNLESWSQQEQESWSQQEQETEEEEGIPFLLQFSLALWHENPKL